MKLLLVSVAVCAVSLAVAQGGIQAGVGPNPNGGGIQANLGAGGQSNGAQATIGAGGGNGLQAGVQGGRPFAAQAGGVQSGQATQALTQDLPVNGQQKENLDKLLKALRVDPCNAKCAAPLMQAVAKTITFNNLYDDAKEVCQAQQQVHECAKRSFCIQPQSFAAMAVSGIEALCEPQTLQKLEQQEQCIKPAVDQIAQRCDSQCNFKQSLMELSSSPALSQGIKSALGSLGPVCKSMPCFFTCFREGLNGRCPQAGTEITKALVQPIYVLKKTISQFGPVIEKGVTQKLLAPECQPLDQQQNIDAIWGGQSGQQSGQQQQQPGRGAHGRGRQQNEQFAAHQQGKGSHAGAHLGAMSGHHTRKPHQFGQQQNQTSSFDGQQMQQPQQQQQNQTPEEQQLQGQQQGQQDQQGARSWSWA